MMIPNLRQPFGLNNDQTPTGVPWGVPGQIDPRVMNASYSNVPPMNVSDLFTAQNLGVNPPPMSATDSPWAGMMAGQPQVQQQMPPEVNHLNDVIQQYTQNKQDQQDTGGLVQQILSNRMQPTTEDAAKSAFLSNQNSQYTSPDQVMDQRFQTQLAPFTEGLDLANKSAELSGRTMQNNITAQTGLPMAMANLQKEQMANDIMAKTGMSRAEAEIALANSQAGYYGSALQRDLASKAFDYANNPSMQQSRLMSQYLSQMSGGQPPTNQPTVGQQSQPPQQNQPQSGQRQFNPMGAMLAKQFGLENMQIGQNGQPEMIPGVVTPAQKQIDTDFAQSLQTYQNAGGAKRTQDTINTIQGVINQLQKGDVTTGGVLDRNAMDNHNDPTWIGRNLDPSVLVARNLISSAILPQAKPLFGARVTNFDAQSLINSKGIDPLADNQTNITKLQNLLAEIKSGQQDLQNGGTYFNQNGTLNGYQPTMQQNSQTMPTISSPSDPAFQQLPSGAQFTTSDGQILVKH